MQGLGDLQESGSYLFGSCCEPFLRLGETLLRHHELFEDGAGLHYEVAESRLVSPLRTEAAFDSGVFV